MRFLGRSLFLLLAILWLPATSHCQLEIAGIIPTDECCEETGFSQSAKQHDCVQNCRDLEEGFFKNSPPLVFLAIPVLGIEMDLFAAAMATDPQLVSPPDPTVPLPRLSEILVRTSLPTRAPSLIS